MMPHGLPLPVPTSLGTLPGTSSPQCRGLPGVW